MELQPSQALGSLTTVHPAVDVLADVHADPFGGVQAVGDAGTILLSDDYGATWMVMQSESGLPLLGIDAIDGHRQEAGVPVFQAVLDVGDGRLSRRLEGPMNLDLAAETARFVFRGHDTILDFSSSSRHGSSTPSPGR